MTGLMLALAVALLASLVLGVNTAAARPCSYHGTAKPHIVRVDNSVATIEGSGAIGGCPRAPGATVRSVRLTVCLQRRGPSGWIDVACKGPVLKSWSRHYRFARQLGLTVSATCVPGLWRTIARGGDGFPPSQWTSAAVKFTSSDQYACGEPGGA